MTHPMSLYASITSFPSVSTLTFAGSLRADGQAGGSSVGAACCCRLVKAGRPAAAPIDAASARAPFCELLPQLRDRVVPKRKLVLPQLVHRRVFPAGRALPVHVVPL